MRAQITFRNGAQIEVDVEELTTKRSQLDGQITGIEWVTPAGWERKLHTLEVDQVLAIVVFESPKTTPE